MFKKATAGNTSSYVYRQYIVVPMFLFLIPVCAVIFFCSEYSSLAEVSEANKVKCFIDTTWNWPKQNLIMHWLRYMPCKVANE